MTLPSDFAIQVHDKHLHEFNTDKTMELFHREMMLRNWCQILCMVGKKAQMGGIGPGRLQEQYFLKEQVEDHYIVGIQTRQLLQLKKRSVQWLWENAKVQATAFSQFRSAANANQAWWNAVDANPSTEKRPAFDNKYFSVSSFNYKKWQDHLANTPLAAEWDLGGTKQRVVLQVAHGWKPVVGEAGELKDWYAIFSLFGFNTRLDQEDGLKQFMDHQNMGSDVNEAVLEACARRLPQSPRTV
jgi:hypothetical protein